MTGFFDGIADAPARDSAEPREKRDRKPAARSKEHDLLVRVVGFLRQIRRWRAFDGPWKNLGATMDEFLAEYEAVTQ